jgi:plastocyanin
MKRMRWPEILGMLALAAVIAPQLAKAQYAANAGAETTDHAVQANGFFPNELWIWAGDTITWTFAPKNEIHTVTFLTANQVRPPAPPPVGPPPFPAGPPFAFGSPVNAPVIPPAVAGPPNCTAYAGSATYTGSTCVSSEPVSGEATFTVTFPTAGNFKLVCLVHTDMTGTVHVLQSADPTKAFYAASLPYIQRDYARQGSDEASDILNDGDNQSEEVRELPANNVIAGIGEIVATGGGTQYRAVDRFLNPTIRIHAGDSVTWVNLDPTEPHTVTFGTENPAPGAFVPTVGAGLGAAAGDGTLTAKIVCSPGPAGTPCDQEFGNEYSPNSGQAYNATTFLNSGFLQAQAPDRTAPGLGVPPSGDTQLPPGTTRITITFPQPGNYYYHCALHDVNGMLGEVIVEK